MRAEDLVDSGVVVVKPYSHNPYSKRGPKPKKKVKSSDDNVAEGKSGEGDSGQPGPPVAGNPSMESLKSLLKLTDHVEIEDLPGDARHNDF